MVAPADRPLTPSMKSTFYQRWLMGSGVGADPLVGVKPVQVAINMKRFEAQCQAMEEKFRAWRISEPEPPDDLVLHEFVVVLAKILEKFFQIHSYADGNGHAGRLLPLVLMTRAGLPPAHWSIDGQKNYGTQVSQHRRKVKQPLEDFILDAIAGP
jgi:hypothetical protein